MRIAAASAAALLALSLMPVPAALAAPKKPVKPAAAAEPRHAGLAAAAAAGDKEAQYQMGLALRDGTHGLKSNAAAALSWFTLAGAEGHVGAAVEAAKAFETGKGVRRDLTSAANWRYQAGLLGDVESRARWIALVIRGEVHGIASRDGLQWLTEAAQAGDSKAVMALADVLEHGLAGTPDLERAEDWYRLAALMYGDVEARYRLGRLLLALPSAWRRPAEEEWNPKEAERNSLPLGAVWYAAKPRDAEEGKAVQLRPGIAEGERWLRSAARRGHAEAQYLLGALKVGGLELPMDMTEGIAWLEAAAVQGHAEALIELGELAAKGQGFFAKDPVRAWVMFDLAAAQGEESAKTAREAVAKGMSQKQTAAARRLAQDLRDLNGL